MIIPSVRITLLPPYWLIPYGGPVPPVFKIRGKDFEFGLAEINSLRQTGGFQMLGHHCHIVALDEATGHLDLSGMMQSGTQPYIDELLAAGWQLCDENALASYRMPQAHDPPPPEPHHPREPQIVGFPPITWAPALAHPTPATPPP